MVHPAKDLARQLAANAEAVCRHYLSNGNKCGRWWSVGDAYNTSGASLFVRLQGSASDARPAGKWTDAATGEHGDLLDLIALNQDCPTLADAMHEARRFLGCTPQPPKIAVSPQHSRGSRSERAARLFHAAQPIAGTPAEAYLQARAITAIRFPCLRFHGSVFYRARDGAPLQRLPAMLAAATNLDGDIVGVHRTWLNAASTGLAAIPCPKRMMGQFLGSAVRFGTASEVLLAGEGIETMLSLKTACPELPMAAGLSASHLAGLALPAKLRRLWIARDEGAAGDNASTILGERAQDDGLDVWDIAPLRDDFNTDLTDLGHTAFTARVRRLLADELARIKSATA